MSIFYTSKLYLEKIIQGEVKFTSVINKAVTDIGLSSEDVHLFKDTLKSVVNRYYFLQFEIETTLETVHLPIDDLHVLMCALAQYHYMKNSVLEEILYQIERERQDLNLSLTKEAMADFFTKIGKKPLLVPEKYNAIIAKRLSLTYSYPEWIVRMIIKHFGVKNTYRSIASTRRSLPIVVNYNPMVCRQEDLAEELYQKTILSDHSFNYIGKEKIIHIDDFKNNRIFVQEEALQVLIDNLEPQQGDDILFMDDTKGVLALDATLRINDFGKMHVCCSNPNQANLARNLAKRFHINSMEIFESDNQLLITHVEPKKMDRVFVMPPSSMLGTVRKNPDVVLSLKREDLDPLIEKEVESLETAALFVKPEGILLYAVLTLNKKESSTIIENFVQTHKDFVLIDERQIFPFEGPCDGVYYAKLKRVNPE